MPETIWYCERHHRVDHDPSSDKNGRHCFVGFEYNEQCELVELRVAGPDDLLIRREDIDYEAALNEYLRICWAKDGMGPYAEELADVVLPNGVSVPRISDFEEAKRIVDAALAAAEGGET